MQSAMSPGKEREAADDANASASSGTEGKVTLDAIKGLLKDTLEPLHASVTDLKSELTGFKHEIKEDITQVKSRMGKVEDNMTMTNIRVKQLEGKLSQGIEPTVNPEMSKKISEIEESIKNMLSTPSHVATPGSPNQNVTAVLGGLGGFGSLDEAENWYRKHLGEWKLRAPLRFYMKGDDAFKGIAFARFSSPDAMAETVSAINSNGIQVKDQPTWSKPERPINERAPISFLFRLKTLMVKWGYAKKSIYVDEDLGTMDICKVRTLEASVKDGVLNLQWIVKDFSTWAELQDNPEFLENMKKCNDSLKSSQEAKSKGVGKGSIKGSF